MTAISYKTILTGVAMSLAFALPALAGDIEVRDAAAEMMEGETDRGDIFVTITNTGTTMDRLYAVRTPVAKSAKLETESEERVVAGAKREATSLAINPGETVMLSEDGAHIELFGLKKPFLDGESFPATLFFEKAGRVTVEVEVE